VLGGQHSVLGGGNQCLVVEVSRCWATRATRTTPATRATRATRARRATRATRATLARVFTFRGHFAVLIFNAERNMQNEHEKQIRIEFVWKKIKKQFFLHSDFFFGFTFSVPVVFEKIGIASSKDRHALLLLA
jgi:hypothetical protein